MPGPFRASRLDPTHPGCSLSLHTGATVVRNTPCHVLPPRSNIVSFSLGRFNATVIWGNHIRVINLAEPSVRPARAAKDNHMDTVLYFSPGGVVYETRAYSDADIAELVHDFGLESLTSADRQFDFWFTPTTRRCRRKVNLSATEMLLATTRFTAKTVPLLRGGVVVATHDSAGELNGLSWQQLDLLIQNSCTLTRRDDRVLSRRITRDERRLQRNLVAADAGTGRSLGQHPVARH